MENIENTHQIANGQLIINEFGNGFVNVKNNNIQNKTIYIKKQDLNRAFNNELVEVLYHQENGQYYGKVINYSLIDRTFIGFVYHFYKEYIYIYVPELKKSNLINIKTKTKLEKGNWIIVKVKEEIENKLYGEFIDKIENDIDIIIQQKYNLDSIELDDEDLKIIENNKTQEDYKYDCETIANKIKRIDQTELDTFTIDPITTQDCDDAFSIKIIDDNIVHIYVHISDVAHFINPDNKLFDTIIKRGNTYYGKNKNWTMMPREYSDNIGSILPNKKTHVVTTEFIFNRKENIIKYVGWYYSDIISKNKYYYELVDDIMESEKDNINNPFNIIYDTSVLLSKEIHDFDINSTTKSHSLVSYWMIKTNQIMCLEIQKLNKHLYRYNAKPDEKKFDLLNNYLKYNGYIQNL